MAAQLYAGMRLVLIAEQTSTVDLPSDGYNCVKSVTTVDGTSVSFQPSLDYDYCGGKLLLNLSLSACKSAADQSTMVRCKMTLGYKHTTTERPVPCVSCETSILFHKGTQRFDKVVSVHVAKDNRNHFTKVTLLFMVFVADLQHTIAPGLGLGVHLNKARLRGNHCDVKLVVDGVELPAHRNVLAARSPVLDKMLTGDFREAREGRVELVDFSRAAVERFLEYLYTDQIEDWGNMELELVQLASKYMVPELRTECSLRLWSCDAPRAVELLRTCFDPSPRQIMSSALLRRLAVIVANNMEALADTEEWTDFAETYPAIVDMILGLSEVQETQRTYSVWEPKYEAFNLP
ncbi:kelch-like protein 34 [Frankliniella occidentalis]|uniref:Kelch-like protein 34 n=1 Tax=Frankliniella occidentalis TaxID=133901 RepID=A0A9C6XW58_FRAOC|nr:kelch-like protein 34 [Frankliniella occidentalis]